MSPTLKERQNIALDTVARSSSITAEHASQSASEESTFIPNQLPPLEQASCPNNPSSKITIVNSDSFTAARAIMDQHPEAIALKTAVLNLASDELRAGGWMFTLARTQEEALCYSSTLYATLKEEYYPWPNLGPGSIAGVFSPAVVIFKHDLDHNCVNLPVSDRRIVSVITVAAPRDPKLTQDGSTFLKQSDLEDLRGKIRLVYRMAASNGQEYLVLGAMGCGAYACPPRVVASEMKSILLEPEFKGWFRQVVFAIYSKKDNGPGNFEIFKEAFDGVEFPSYESKQK